MSFICKVFVPVTKDFLFCLIDSYFYWAFFPSGASRVFVKTFVLKPYPPTGIQVPTLAGWPPFLVDLKARLLFSAVEDNDDVLGVRECVLYCSQTWN